MICGSVTALTCPIGGIPPNNANYQLPVGTYAGSATVDFTKLKIFALTSHEHQRGSDVKIWKSTAASPTAQQLFDNPDWSSPPLQVYDDSHVLGFAQGEGAADDVEDCALFGEASAPRS